DRHLWMEVVVERVGPQQDSAWGAAVGLGAAAVARVARPRTRPWALPPPSLERRRRERRHVALGRNSGDPLAHGRERPPLREEIREPRRACRELGLPADQAERVCLARS